jgi:hypothetical protein
MAGNTHDGTVAQMVPQAVEKIPLFHWRPGARLLVIGSRDGASFDDDVESAEARTFHRRLDRATVETASAKLLTDGICAAWSASLLFPESLSVLASMPGPLVIATPAFGDEVLLDPLFTRVDAWLLLIGARPGPLARAILDRGKHVEVALGLSGKDRLPKLDWERARAVHLAGRRIAVDAAVEGKWLASARAQLPAGIPVYDPASTHTDCTCGARLVWRSGGRSRLDALDPAGNTCKQCGAKAAFAW